MSSSPTQKALIRPPSHPLDRLILWVGSDAGNTEVLENIRKCLNLAFCSEEESPAVPPLNYNWQFECCSTPSEAKDFLSGVAIPSLLLLGPDPENFPESSTDWDALCRGIRALDSQACILTLSSEAVPSGDTAVGWMDRGANGLFNPSQKPEHSFTLLRELLTLPLKNMRPREARVETQHKVELRIASIEQAIASETMNVGTGGLFIRAIPQGAEVGDLIEFTLKFDDSVSVSNNGREDDPRVLKMEEDSSKQNANKVEDISGEGRIAWIRRSAGDGLPEGIGLQFTLLSAADFKRIQDFVARRRVKAFIPKS